MTGEDVIRERRALHKAIQDVIREFEDEGMIIGCALTFEVARPEGGKMLCHRNFTSEGESLAGWTAEGYLTDHLRVIDMQLKEGLTDTEDEE